MSNKIVEWWNVEFDQQETDSVAQSIVERNISQGVITQRFETEFAKKLDMPYAIATTSGSVALLMALMTVGIKQGDEVILPNRSFIATPHAVMMSGGTVVLVGTLPDIPVMDVSQITKKITPCTKAIMPIHLNGRSVDMEVVNNIASECGLPVIEDAAQALFSKNLTGYLGTQSDIGCFSFGMAKLLPTGQGGMLVTKKRELYNKLKLIRNHGVFDTFHPDSAYDNFGFNFKYTDLQASIGVEQLKKIPAKIEHLKKVYIRYREGLNDIKSLRLIPVNIENGEVPIYIEVLCNDSREIIAFLSSHKIQARPFHPDLSQSSHLKSKNTFKHPSIFQKRGIILPGGPNLSLDNVDLVLKTLHLYEDVNCKINTKHA
tara:strand:+ start:2577 stop:3698 length:1122 start_codon:yes stop_codon:yes gene_type:complete